MDPHARADLARDVARVPVAARPDDLSRFARVGEQAKRRLAAATCNSFALGVVLYDHEHVVPFKERMFAAPLSALWS